ncbi:MAG: response regulator transcription factor [Oligoflexia bacterium]|nr:response regulator transcription factor [Oligoflexia bacterium]
MLNILLIDDSSEMTHLIPEILDSFQVETAVCIEDGKILLSKKNFDLILLDIFLPDGNGLRFLKDLRSDYKLSALPVILISGDTSTENKLEAWRLLADDFIEKPFSLGEFKARIEAKIKLRHQIKTAGPTCNIGDLYFQLQSNQLNINSSTGEFQIKISPTEFKTLLYLAQFQNFVKTRKEIRLAVWGIHTHVLDRTIDAHICKLRKKIKPSQYEILPASGTGYKLSLKIPTNIQN